MKVNAKSYPNPVLGNEDDINGVFHIEFRYELGRTVVTLNPLFTLKNKAIEDLIKKEKASFVVEVECRSTFYRSSFSSRDVEQKISIPAKMLRGRVQVGFFICADEDISDYKPSDCHPDYAEATFELEKGDVIAVGGHAAFPADKAFDPLRPPVSSFMSIREGFHHEGPMEIDYSSDKITIELSKADWRNYVDVRNDKLAEAILHSSVVFPVLLDAIYQLNSGEHVDSNWFGRLEAILDSKDLRGKPAFEAAQRILDNPSARNFQSINAILEANSDDVL
jgi:hypothetical protein